VAAASSATTYIESAAGVAVGGRTGLTSLVTACGFFLALFFSPLAAVVPPQATAGALIVVGYLMISALTEAEEEAIAEDIDRSGADVVWVGIGVPKQEKWMARMRHRLEAPVLVGVGAAFDFHAGLVRQAPPGLQRAGLEWAFRLAMEPGRLWRRYARYNPRFVAGFARQYANHRLGRGRG
jgi:N-acetylglucosaminyldiphosphoundecaprenol N-acetyl-beta-D-mannosaminyltransferase